MLLKIFFSAAVLFCMLGLTVNAQTRLDNPNTHKDSDFLFMGKHNMNGTAISGLGACIATGHPRTRMATVFKLWITDLSEVAALKMFNLKRCELVGFVMKDNPGYKYRTVNSFTDYAAGNTIYKVEAGNLVLVKKFAGEIYYIIVAKRATAYKLSDLDICGPPDVIQRHFKSRLRGANRVSSSNCHDLKQQIDKVKYPTKYAASMNRTSAVLFQEKDYLAQKKRGLFRGKAVYTFEGGDTMAAIK